MTQKEQFIEWLSDAYAMERALVDTLKKHAVDAKAHPDICIPIEAHCEVTQEHADAIRSLLEDLGADSSTLKTAVARVSGLLTALPVSVAADTLVKNALAEYASEHFEIASYTSLIAAATELGFEEAVDVLGDILADEQEMAESLEISIPEITTMHLGELAAA